MRIIDIKQIQNEVFYLDEISSILQTPSYRSFKTASRRFNGFLYIESGECTYNFEKAELNLSRGALIYLPKGSCHKMKVVSENISFTRINFELKDKSGNSVLFGEAPVLMAESVSDSTVGAIHKLNEISLIGEKKAYEMSLLYQILTDLTRSSVKQKHGKAQPAVRYIQEHFYEDIDIALLSELCFLSTAQFYRVFKKELSLTPVEYRNRLRINRAKLLLQEEDLTVGEIAVQLGYENIYYFSRAFKSAVGLSPTKYREKEYS